MPTRFHTLMKHTDDFDQATAGHAIVENVDRSSYLDIGTIAARVTHVKTANAGQKLGAVARCWSFWIRRHFPHCHCK